MPISARFVGAWLVGVALLTAATGLGYAASQQSSRRTVDDAPRALATAAASALARGQDAASATAGLPVDLRTGDLPFVTVYDGTHRLLASNATLDGRPLTVPPGVLDQAVAVGEDAVTWQPADGVREAIVARPWTSAGGHGVVVAGLSLAATEQRTGVVRDVLAATWVLGVLGVSALALLFVVRARRRGDPLLRGSGRPRRRRTAAGSG